MNLSKMRKRIVSIVLTMLLAIGTLSGCQRQGGGLETLQKESGMDSESSAQGRYQEEEIALPDGVSQVADIKILKNGDLAIIDDTNGYCTSSDMGKSWKCINKEFVQQLAEKREGLMNASISADGSIAMVTIGIPQTEEETDEEPGIFDYYYKAYWLDATGAFRELSLEGRGEEYITNVVCTPDGCLFGTDTEGNLFEIDTESGKCTDVCNIGEHIVYMAGGKEHLYLLAMDKFLVYDIEIKEVTEDAAVTDFLIKTYGGSGKELLDYMWQCSFAAFEGEEDIMYIACKAGLYRHAIGGSLMEEIVDGNLSTLGDPSATLVNGCYTEDGQFMICNSSGKVYRYYYDATLPTVPQEEIEVYSLLENETIRQSISNYRKSHPNVYISYRHGMDADDSMTIEDAMKQLSVDILSGNGPDVLILDGLPLESYIDKNMLLDLKPYFQQEFEARQYFSNIAACYEKDDHLYVMPAKFRMPVIMGDENVISGIKDLNTFRDALQQIRDKRPEGSVLEIYSERELLALIEKIDSCHWLKDGKEINKEALQQYLTSATEIYKLVEQGVTQEEREMFANEAMASDEMLSLLDPDAHYEISNYFYQYLQEKTPFLAGGVSGMEWKMTIITSTFAQLQKGDFSIWRNGKEACFEPTVITGICANTQSPDAAVDFVKEIFSSEVQAVENKDGLPVNREAMQKIFVPKEADQDGVYGETSMAWDGEDGIVHDITLECKAMNTEEQKQFLKLVEELDTPGMNDLYVRNIVLQKGCEVLEGKKSVEEAVEDIYSQLNLYLNE